MKKLTNYCCHLIVFTLLLASYSCKKEALDTGGTTDKVPTNVHLSDYSSASITVAWDRIEGATSYTVQLLGSEDSEQPLDAYTTTSKDFYRFSGLEETRGYYLRVRANVNYDTGEWVYITDGQERARIMPKYGIVDKDFEEPEPEPVKELYPNFPEGWENHESVRKGGYGGDSDVFPSGEWLMPNMYLNSVDAIVHKIGEWGLMMRNNVATSLEMNFDLPYGASKFSFYYGTVTKTNSNDTDAESNPILVTVEYSQDSGVTWIALGDDLEVNSVEIQYFKEYELDIKGPVRFRISKNDSRARLMVDEISVHVN